MLMFVGTYTHNTDSKGIYALELNGAAGLIAGKDSLAVVRNPSFLVCHPKRTVLYAVSEVSDQADGGTVNAFRFDRDGRLDLISTTPSMGGDPCHLALNGAGTALVVSNYGGGNFATFELREDGAISAMSSFVQHRGRGVDPVRQKKAHVHSATMIGEAVVCVADLGLDQVISYPISPAGLLRVDRRKMTRLRPGAGPRHMVIDRNLQYAYVINELDNTIVSLACNGDGVLVELGGVSSLPPDFDGPSYTAHIAMSADGRFLYASNRGHDSIAVFAIEAEGRLRPVQYLSSGGAHPRHFALSPDQSWLLVANRDSNNIVLFKRDSVTGELTATGTSCTVPAAVCICFASGSG